MRSRLCLITTGVIVFAIALAACTPDVTPAPTEVFAEPTAIPASAVPPTVAATAEVLPLAGYKDATYQIEGTSVTLVDGLSEVEAAPGSASKIVTRYFGNDAVGDLDGDGKEDVAFLLTQNSGGSGTFYYVVVALCADTGYQGTNAVFLGDRIAPQSTNIDKDMVVVNYAERKPDESFATEPSVDVSKLFKVIDGKLVEVAIR